MANNKHSVVDWDKVERLYKGGLIPIKEIAKQFGVTYSQINYRALKMKWSRELTREVLQRSDRLQTEQIANAFKPFEERLQNMKDDQIIEEAARTQVEVIRQHQDTLKRGHGLTMSLLVELEAVTNNLEALDALIQATETPKKREAGRRALQLASRASTLKSLADSAAQWIKLERQAFNIVDQKDKTEKDTDTENMSVEELYVAIQKDAAQIGLDLKEFEVNPDDGLSNKVH